MIRAAALRLSSLLAAAALLLPGPAAAHVAVTGSEGFITGLSQPFLEIQAGIAAISVGLFFGQKGGTLNERAANVFLIALVVGLASAFLPLRIGMPVEALYAVCIVMGLLIAAAPSLPRMLSLPLSAVAGILIGMGSVPDPASFAAIAFTTAGSLVCMAFLFLYGLTGAQWLVTRERHPWLKIVLRVLGSWITAIGLLVFALSFRL